MLWQIKAAIGLSVLLLLAGAFFYVKHLNSTIDDLKANNVVLTEANRVANETIAESTRREGALDRINTVGNKQRAIIEKRYQTQLKSVDDDVTQGKDRAVGPLLLHFFNGDK